MTGVLKDRVDRLWEAFRSSGVTPRDALDQITLLLFLRRLDERQDPAERPRSGSLWRQLIAMQPQARFELMARDDFRYLRERGEFAPEYAHIVRDARFTISTANLLSRALGEVDRLPLERSGDGIEGDLYEYLLSKVDSADGPRLTPRHIVELMVSMTDPQPGEQILDPACGSAGFLVESAKHLAGTAPFETLPEHVCPQSAMLHGLDVDRGMLRIAGMNLLAHGIAGSKVNRRDSLSEAALTDRSRYSLILCDPPFGVNHDQDSAARDLQRIGRTKKQDLLFIALYLELLRPGGRAAVVVPDGVLFGTTNAHRQLRRILVEDNKLDAVVKLPAGVWRPFSGISTAILFFTRTDQGRTRDVWFYDVAADGWSLDNKRRPLLEPERLGPKPITGERFTDADHDRNNLPDLLRRWFERDGAERERPRTAQSFCVPLEEIRNMGYDLSISRYRAAAHTEPSRRAAAEILADLDEVESAIQPGLDDIRKALES